MGLIPQELVEKFAVTPYVRRNACIALLLDEAPVNLLWRAIFKDDTWIEEAQKVAEPESHCPVLIGPDLDSITNGAKETYDIILAINDYNGDVIYLHKLLFASFREGCIYDKESRTVKVPSIKFRTVTGRKFQFPSITLYIEDVICGPEMLTFPNNTIRQLFSHGAIRTQYCTAFEDRIYILDGSRIFGIGGQMVASVSRIPICGLKLFSPEGGSGGNRWRPIFLKEKDCPRMLKQMWDSSNGYKELVGWEAAENVSLNNE